MRKVLILIVVILFASTAIALASWQVASWVRGDNSKPAPGGVTSAKVKGQSPTAPADEQAAEGRGSSPAGGEAGKAGDTRSGEASEYDNPDARYVTETQRHQNFFKALAEGRVQRLDVTATNFQPASDPNSSYLYVIVTTTDGSKDDGRIDMKYEGGLWRIGAIRLSGSLAGGTNYPVPSSFEGDLARELRSQQGFLKKAAEGSLSYLTINAVTRGGEGEVVLTGTAGSKGGNTFPAEMRLRKDYELWHLTSIVAL